MEENIQKKSGPATLTGRPNVGKSTLMNHLIGQKTAVTPGKPQMTRSRIQVVRTDDRGQIIFLDTPGIHKAKNKLGEYMANVAECTLKEVDVMLWPVEPATLIGAGKCHIAEQLKNAKTPVILIVNKVDTVKNQDETLTFIVVYKDVCDFAEIVPLSVLKDKNTGLLTELISKYLPYGLQFYNEDTVTDQPMRQTAFELIREKALRLLDDEIPHGIAVTIEKMKERKDGLADIKVSTVCEREFHKGIITGRDGSVLRRIGIEARREIESMMDTWVNLQLWVKVRKKWRDNELYMKNYGYNQKEV